MWLTNFVRCPAESMDSLKNTALEVTEIDIIDNTVEAVRCDAEKVFSVQYSPESAPGPQDSICLFDDFIELMKK